jgi:hypothetical protein
MKTVTAVLAMTSAARSLDGMRPAACVAVSLALGVLVLATAAEARAADKPRRVYQAVDAQAMVVTHLFPHTFFGGDLAYVIGSQNFQARFGGQVASGRAFNLGSGTVGNTLAVFSLDACGAKKVFKHRVRMCVGGQGGMLAHRWGGFDRHSRNATPYAAGVLKGDYTYSINDRFAMMFGVGVTMPVLGPEFRAREAHGHLSPIVFAGPVTGLVTLGGSFSL